MLELLKTKDKLKEYDFMLNVPSDVAVGERFLPPETEEKIKVNKASNQSYKNLTIPYLQRKLNDHKTRRGRPR